MGKAIPANQKYRWNSKEMRFVSPLDLSPSSDLLAGIVSLLLESVYLPS